jgi:hypothetical protein
VRSGKSKLHRGNQDIKIQTDSVTPGRALINPLDLSADLPVDRDPAEPINANRNGPLGRQGFRSLQ